MPRTVLHANTRGIAYERQESSPLPPPTWVFRRTGPEPTAYGDPISNGVPSCACLLRTADFDHTCIRCESPASIATTAESPRCDKAELR